MAPQEVSHTVTSHESAFRNSGQRRTGSHDLNLDGVFRSSSVVAVVSTLCWPQTHSKNSHIAVRTNATAASSPGFMA